MRSTTVAVDGPLLVVSLFDFIPGAQSLRLFVRKVDVAFLAFALHPHHVNFVTRVELGVALVVQHLGDGQHALGLGADIHNDMRGSQLEHRTLEHVIFADRFFALGGERLQSGGEVFAAGADGGLLFRSWLGLG